MALNEPIPDEKTPLKALIKVNSISEWSPNYWVLLVSKEYYANERIDLKEGCIVARLRLQGKLT